MSKSINNQFKVNPKNFKVIREINRGAFGIVYEVEESKTSVRYAAKVILTGNSKQAREMVNREVQIMMRVSHPTLIGFRGYSTTDFSGNKNITIFMDLIERGSLEEILTQVQKGLADGDYNNTSRQIILIGIAYGMMSLHQNFVIHRDLKPGNILIDKHFYPHITNFGLSKFIDSGHSKSQSKSCGTPIYMAPEVIDGERYDGKADVYSFGIIMYQIVTDSVPYPLFEKGKLKEFKFNKKVVDENYRPSFTVPVKKEIKKLIQRCWAKNPKDRPTFEEIFNRLAYNREGAIYNVFEEQNEEEEQSEDDDDETPYYLSDVSVDEIFLYLDVILDNGINKFESNDLIERLAKTVNDQQKIIMKIQNEYSKFMIEQKEKSKQQEKLIQNQKERIDSLEKQIIELKNKVIIF